MARTVRSAKLDTRSARAKLHQSKAPYWAAIAPGFALGYRKGAKGGVWVAKHVGAFGRQETTVGPADDALDADGITAITFSDAQERARAWLTGLGNTRKTKPYSVNAALDDYLAWYRSESDSAKGIAATVSAIEAHIRPALGDASAAELTADRIEEWLRGLSSAAARLRTRKGATKRNTRANGTDKESRRRRKATANRILTILKAALNRAYRAGKVASDHEWRKVQPHRKVDAAKVRYLTKAECQRLVNAAPEKLRAIVRAALLTGCRYGELAALRVADFNPDVGTLTIRTSKSGKPRHVPLDDDGRTFFATVTAGRKNTDTMFLGTGGEPWGQAHQHRPMIVACKKAKIDPPASFHILRHTYASHLAMGGVPMAVVAAILGHGDTRMTEKHYAHLSPDHVALTLRANAPQLGIVELSNVVAISASRIQAP